MSHHSNFVGEFRIETMTWMDPVKFIKISSFGTPQNFPLKTFVKYIFLKFQCRVLQILNDADNEPGVPS